MNDRVRKWPLFSKSECQQKTQQGGSCQVKIEGRFLQLHRAWLKRRQPPFSQRLVPVFWGKQLAPFLPFFLIGTGFIYRCTEIIQKYSTILNLVWYNSGKYIDLSYLWLFSLLQRVRVKLDGLEVPLVWVLLLVRRPDCGAVPEGCLLESFG